MNLHEDFNSGVTLRMNVPVNLVPYLPRNASCILILVIRLESALLSWEQSIVCKQIGRTIRISNYGSTFYFPWGNLSHPRNIVTLWLLTVCALVTLGRLSWKFTQAFSVYVNETFRNSGLSYLNECSPRYIKEHICV